MLVGQGALYATEEVTEVADILGAGVAKALLGKAVVSDYEPWVTGAIGLLGTGPSWALMQGADTLLMVGTNMPYSDFLPREGQARGIQIGINGKWLGFRYPTEVNLAADSKKTLRALTPMLERKTDCYWRGRVERAVGRWWKVVEARAMNRENQHPEREPNPGGSLPERGGQGPHPSEHSAGRRGEDDQRLGRDTVRSDSGERRLRDELRPHARAALAPGLPLRIGADAGSLHFALPRLQETRLVLALAR
jgi:hypothetical protein